MAFPTTGILDDFNRSSPASLGANWSVLQQFLGTGDLAITSNQAYNDKAIGNSYVFMYWNVAPYGPDCEVYMTLATAIPNSTADSFISALRIQEPTGSWDGYALTVNPASGTEVWSISRVDNEVFTQLGATASQAVVNGDKVGFEAIVSTLKGYLGSWTEILSRTDSTYGSAGYLGFYGTGTVVTWRYDDFGGGTIAAVASGWGQLLSDSRNRITA